MLIFEKVFSKVGDLIVRIWPGGIVLTKSGELIDLQSKHLIGKLSSPNGEVVRVSGGWLVADWIKNQLQFSYVSEVNRQTEALNLDLRSAKLFRYENRLFVVTDAGLTELALKHLGRPILAVNQTWGVMINATRWFDGVGVQDALGAIFLVTPFGDKSFTQVRVKELDRLKVVSAKAGHRFTSVVAVDRNGDYHKLEFTFDHDYQSYQLWQGKTDSPDLNVAILPKGVCATITEDGELNIFVPTAGKLNRVEDKKITTSMALANWGDYVIYIENGEVWRIRMK